jgi:vitamin B12 transporter
MRTIVAVCISIVLFTTSAVIAEENTPGPIDNGWMTLVAANAESDAPASETASTALDEPETLEPVIVTATSIATPVSRVGSSVTVITREQMEQLGSNSALEALRQVPGISLVQTGTRGGTVDLFTRGGRPDFTLVLIDGVQMTDQSGRANLAHFTIDNIERIEVVRGPQSALYGADALSGVINIITNKGDGEPTIEVSAAAGNLDNRLGTFSFSGSAEAFNYSIAGSHYGTASIDRLSNDNYINNVLSARAGFSIEDELDLSFIFRYQDSERENPGPTQFMEEDPDDETDSQDVSFTIQYDQELTEWWNHFLQLSYTDQTLNAEDLVAQDPFNDAAFTNDTTFNRFALNYKQDFYVLEDHVLTAGVDWEQEEADIVSVDSFTGTTIIDDKRHNLGFYAQAALSFYDRFDVVAGLRYDDNTEYGSETTPRINANYLLVETGTRLKASYGEGIKNPTFLDLFFSSPPFFFANPDLNPEESEAWDVGFEQTLLDGQLTVGATYFHTDYEELIASVEISPGVFSLENLDDAESKGFEVEATAQLPYHLTLRGAYTFTETEDDEGSDLVRVPKHLISLNLNYSHERWMVNLDAMYASRRSDINFVFIDDDGDFENDITDDDADSYVVLNLAAEYQLNDNIWITGSIENLLDDEYEQVLGFENPGINFLAGVRGVF